MKLHILRPVVCLLAAAGISCTANYLDINGNPYEPDEDQMQADGYIIGATLTALSTTVVSTDVNTAQFTDVLMGGPLGGYFSTTGNFPTGTIMNFNPTDDWTNVLMASDKIIPVLYSNLRELERVTDDPITLAIAEVIKVAAMSRVTDTYGPIPYSKVGEDGKLQVPYDSQEEVYTRFFEELDHAIGVLTEHRTGAIAATADYIYGGSAEKWCRFANSLKLRLAMRIVYADEAKARQMAESAVKSEVGVMTANADNAMLTTFGEKGNPIYTAVNYNSVTAADHPDGKDCQTGGDTHVAADIICYMNGYNDPRRPAYFIPSEWSGYQYVGMRRSIQIPSLVTVGHKYSGVKCDISSPVYWMNAAEVAFLKAEAKAVFGFDMGPGTAEEFYREGIRLSFEQWGVSGWEEYAAGQTVPENYRDPNGTNSYDEQISDITVAWDEGASPEKKQERIITQKWIANWQLGNEAWADFRRTGYPRLMPATAEGNKSNGKVDSRMGARRMPYPQVEYTTNGENVRQAVASYLNGGDDMATRLWWDCKQDLPQLR